MPSESVSLPIIETAERKVDFYDDRKKSGSGISESESENGLNSFTSSRSESFSDREGSRKWSDESELQVKENADYLHSEAKSGGSGCHAETGHDFEDPDGVEVEGVCPSFLYLSEDLVAHSLPEQGGFVCVPSSISAPGMDYNPVAEALSNELVIEEICLNLPVSDLKKVRLVNKVFKEKATPILLKKKALEVSLWYSFARESYTRFKRGKNPTELENLNELIQSSISQGNKFPCSTFRFGFHFEFNFDMLTFFSIYGSKMRCISLALDEPLKAAVLRELLLNKAPNLERLEFRQFEAFEDRPRKGDNSELFPSSQEKGSEPVILPQLKYLYVGWQPTEEVKRMVRSLIIAAVNLETFDGYRLEYHDIFVDTNKVSIIKEFDFVPTRANKLFVDRLVNTPPQNFPKLTELTVDLFEARKHRESVMSVAGKAVRVIMETSQSTLTKLSMSSVGKYPEIQFPMMESVSELRFLPSGFGRSRPMFSPKFSVCLAFPWLQTCDLTLLNLYRDSLVDYFPGEQYNQPTSSTFVTVQLLKINNAMSQEDLVFISNNFPNVKQVQVYCAKKVVISNRIWTLPKKVESIDLYGIDVGSLASRPYALDSFFTGIPRRVCKNLSQLKNPKLRVQTDLKDLQQYAAMSNLQNLKRLSIFLHQTFEFFGAPYVDDSHDFKGSAPPFVSHVTNHYAFSLMPSEFKVRFSYDHGTQGSRYLKKMLQPLSEFVSVVHHDETYFHLMWSK